MSGRPFLSLRPARRSHPVLTQLPLAIVLEGQFESGHFQRLDVALRARVGRALLETGEVPESLDELYRRMQHERAGKDTRENFRRVAHSVRANGIDPAYPVGVSPKGPLLDGAHRTALSLVLNVPTLAVDLRPSKIPSAFGREWFLAHGFGEEVVRELEQEMDGFFRATGHDTCVVVAGIDFSLAGLEQALGGHGILVAARVVTSAEVDVAELQRRLTHIPRHASAARDAPRVRLEADQFTVARVRWGSRTWNTIPKTHTATLAEALALDTSLTRAGHQVIVGSTIAQNRDAWALLAGSDGQETRR